MEHIYKDHLFGDTLVRYVILKESGKVFLELLPAGALKQPTQKYYSYSKEGQFPDNYDWFGGALFHLQLSHHSRSPYAGSHKLSDSYDDMYFKEQKVIREDGKTVVETLVVSDEGYEVLHRLTNFDGEDGFEVSSIFKNNTGADVRLEMFEGASLDCLSPYADDDGSKDVHIHVFRSGWATEGCHFDYTLPELNLGKGWGGNFKNFKIGTKGSRATADYFPFAAVEDRAANIIWGIQLYCPSTWQMEFSRAGGKLSFSAGLGDASFGNWTKIIKNGETFESPKALAAGVKGGIADIADVFLKMRNKDVEAYGEQGMPIIFNEWCTSWGKPSHEKNIRIADKLKNSKLKYFVMDAGWYSGAIGDWEVRSDIFPKGLKAYTDDVRSRGFVPGIWMEFECTNKGSVYYSGEYDGMHLKHDGNVIVGQVNKGRCESFWDLRNADAFALLEKKVIKFLKDNGFGYLKVDYNADIGSECDGAESGGEGLRQHMLAVQEFFKKIKKDIPGIVIENCASGGMRLEPSMMALSAMGSFSDAHESVDIPVIAANLQYLIPPRQSQVWCVMKPGYDSDRFSYTISAGFLGRLCWSGDIVGLSDAQMSEIYRAEEMYEEVSGIIRSGKSFIYRTEETVNFRYPEGTQAVVRYADDGERALIVYHCFEKPQKLEIPLDGSWEIQKTLYGADITVSEDNAVIHEDKSFCGNVVLLKRTGE